MRITNVGTNDVALLGFRDAVLRTQCYAYEDSVLFSWIKSAQRPYIVSGSVDAFTIGWAAYCPYDLRFLTDETIHQLSMMASGRIVVYSRGFAIYVRLEHRGIGHAIKHIRALRDRMVTYMQQLRYLQQRCPKLRFELECAPHIKEFVTENLYHGR